MTYISQRMKYEVLHPLQFKKSNRNGSSNPLLLGFTLLNINYVWFTCIMYCFCLYQSPIKRQLKVKWVITNLNPRKISINFHPPLSLPKKKKKTKAQIYHFQMEGKWSYVWDVLMACIDIKWKFEDVLVNKSWESNTSWGSV